MLITNKYKSRVWEDVSSKVKDIKIPENPKYSKTKKKIKVWEDYDVGDIFVKESAWGVKLVGGETFADMLFTNTGRYVYINDMKLRIEITDKTYNKRKRPLYTAKILSATCKDIKVWQGYNKETKEHSHKVLKPRIRKIIGKYVHFKGEDIKYLSK